MNAKKRILGGAILTALAGTGAYFCSNNDDKLQTSYEKTSIEQSIRAEQSEQDFLDIIAKPYLGERTLEQEIAKETPAEKKPESLDERVKRLSDLFEKYYVTTNEIRRSYDRENHIGKIKTSEGNEIKYSLEKDKLFFKFTPKMLLAIKFQYDHGQINIVRWRVEEKNREDDLVLFQELNGPLTALSQTYKENSLETKEIKSNSEVSGFLRWNDLVSNIITRHPELFK